MSIPESSKQRVRTIFNKVKSNLRGNKEINQALLNQVKWQELAQNPEFTKTVAEMMVNKKPDKVIYDFLKTQIKANIKDKTKKLTESFNRPFSDIQARAIPPLTLRSSERSSCVSSGKSRSEDSSRSSTPGIGKSDNASEVSSVLIKAFNDFSLVSDPQGLENLGKRMASQIGTLKPQETSGIDSINQSPQGVSPPLSYQQEGSKTIPRLCLSEDNNEEKSFFYDDQLDWQFEDEVTEPKETGADDDPPIVHDLTYDLTGMEPTNYLEPTEDEESKSSMQLDTKGKKKGLKGIFSLPRSKTKALLPKPVTNVETEKLVEDSSERRINEEVRPKGMTEPGTLTLNLVDSKKHEMIGTFVKQGDKLLTENEIKFREKYPNLPSGYCPASLFIHNLRPNYLNSLIESKVLDLNYDQWYIMKLEGSATWEKLNKVVIDHLNVKYQNQNLALQSPRVMNAISSNEELIMGIKQMIKEEIKSLPTSASMTSGGSEFSGSRLTSELIDGLAAVRSALAKLGLERKDPPVFSYQTTSLVGGSAGLLNKPSRLVSSQPILSSSTYTSSKKEPVIAGPPISIFDDEQRASKKAETSSIKQQPSSDISIINPSTSFLCSRRDSTESTGSEREINAM